ncbi:MAG: helix-turn-helix transcriptional regulator [Mycobacterium sp.]
MDNRGEVREFLASRRGRITPERAGLPNLGGHRRVPGLRREEVAMLAGVSVDYYTRLERGNLGGVSQSVLESLAQALQLDEAERSHLLDLARAANDGMVARGRRRSSPRGVRPGLQRILDAVTDAPADVRNARRDVLAANRLSRTLYSEMYDDPVRPANLARFTFLNPRSKDFFPDWEKGANDLVASLRIEAGSNPYDRDLSDLIGELSTRSDEFAARWATHNVRLHNTGTKRIHHPIAGDLVLSYEVLKMPGDPGLSLAIYTAEPGSPTEEALRFLGSWSDANEGLPRDRDPAPDAANETTRGTP